MRRVGSSGRYVGFSEINQALKGDLSFGTDQAMPTLLRDGPYRVYFYSHDLEEPPHVHVDRDEKSAKFWLDSISMARNLGFKPQELRVIERLLVENQETLLKAWREHMGLAK
jgi:Domain of unknown function (DUF4160)